MHLSRTRAGSRRRRVRATNLLLFIGILMVILHFLGKVQVNFALRENELLELQKQRLQREVDDLNLQVDSINSYQRIVRLAERRGLIFPPASSREDLPVDLDGFEKKVRVGEQRLNLAGLFGKL